MTPGLGYAGRYLSVDLRSRELAPRPLDDRLLEYVGGLGIATRLVMDAWHPGMRPEDDDNPFAAFTGPLTGSGVPTSSRTAVVALSPQSGALGSSNFGGFWGAALKRAGWDGLLVTGRCRDWSYLFLDGDEVTLGDAALLEGKDAWETQDLLSALLSPEDPGAVHVLAVGVAGEHEVGCACLTADYFNSASRCGLGAVLGGKRLKAIAVRGRGAVGVADAPGLQARVLAALDTSRRMPAPFGLGCFDFVQELKRGGSFPHQNFEPGSSGADSSGLSREKALACVTGSPDYRTAGRACHACPRSCFLSARVPEGPWAGLQHTGLVPAAILCWSGRCEINTYPGIWKCEQACDRLGLDMFSAATLASWTMERFEAGALSAADTGGLELRWGDEAALVEFLQRLAGARGDFFRLLGRGVEAAAAVYGGFAPAVKRLEMYGVDPRRVPFAYAVGDLFSPRGGDNIANTHNLHFLLHRHPPEAARALLQRLQIPGKEQIFAGTLTPQGPLGIARLVVWAEGFNNLVNCLGTCILEQLVLHFTFGTEHYADLFRRTTGLPLDEPAIARLSDRLVAMQRVVASQAGLTASHDAWPDRFYDEPVQGGQAISRELVRETVSAYYRLRRWEPGRPGARALGELGLAGLASGTVRRAGATSAAAACG